MARRLFIQPAKKSISEVEREYPSRDPIADRLRVRGARGPIEVIENQRFPWLKKRRERRPKGE